MHRTTSRHIRRVQAAAAATIVTGVLAFAAAPAFAAGPSPSDCYGQYNSTSAAATIQGFLGFGGQPGLSWANHGLVGAYNTLNRSETCGF